MASGHDRPAFRSLLSAAFVLAFGIGAIEDARADEPASAAFVDRTKDLGFDPGNGPACWVDLDNDGWTDLCTGGVAWKNEGGRRFTRLADGFGDVVAADFDNDGFADLFSFTSLRAWRNDGGKKFVPIDIPGLPKTISRGACWGDFDRDGFVDLYVGGYEDWDADVTYPNLVLKNEAGSKFRLISNEARHRSRGVTACDFDEDGDLDVYVSNYRLQPNDLWLNDGKGTFKNVARERNAVATSPGFRGGHSIGAAWGDFDNDGRIDLFAGNFAHVDDRGDQPKSRFLRNRGPSEGFAFEDKGPCGIHYQESYASPAAADFDNDGDLDLFFTTVYGTASFGRPNNPVLYRNDGEFKFTDVTEASGLSGLPPTYQAAWADFDNDGDLDLISGGKIFENRAAKGHWVKVRLTSPGKESNASAIGAQARITLDGKALTRQVEAGTGEGNQNDLALHFGLGAAKGPVTLEIAWPDGTKQSVAAAEVDRRIDVTRTPKAPADGARDP